MKIGRNAPCPCGSGRKYKSCCLDKKTSTPLYQRLLIALIALVMAGGVISVFASLRSIEPGGQKSTSIGTTCRKSLLRVCFSLLAGGILPLNDAA